MRSPSKTLIILIGLFAVVFASDTYTVVKVIDGDTFKLENGESVRLIGVDTPETVHPNKPVEYFGKEASAFTKQLLEGKTVRLEYDQQKRDKYDRILAYVFLDTLLVNAELIRQGYGHAYTIFPFKQDYMDLFRNLEKEARENKRGLWAPVEEQGKEDEKNKYWLNTGSNTLHNSSCKWYGTTKAGYFTNEVVGRDCGICGGALQTKSEDSQLKPNEDVTVYVTKTGKKYHRSGCRYLKKSQVPIKLKDAKGRYGPCSVCNPPG